MRKSPATESPRITAARGADPALWLFWISCIRGSRSREVTLQCHSRIDYSCRRKNRDQQEQYASARELVHGRLHPVLSLSSCNEKTPSFGASAPNCQAGNSFTPAPLHSDAISPG